MLFQRRSWPSLILKRIKKRVYTGIRDLENTILEKVLYQRAASFGSNIWWGITGRLLSSSRTSTL